MSGLGVGVQYIYTLKIMRFSFVLLSIIMTALLSLNACTNAWDQYPTNPEELSITKPSTIAIGDVISITVTGENDLSNEYTVTDDGTITMPLAGSIKIQGLNAVQARQSIRSALMNGGYLVNPEVIVTTHTTQSFYIMGEILNAGEFKHTPGMTLLEAVAKAGGFSYRANQTTFDIVRHDETQGNRVIRGNIASNIRPGDIIRVRERLF